MKRLLLVAKDFSHAETAERVRAYCQTIDVKEYKVDLLCFNSLEEDQTDLSSRVHLVPTPKVFQTLYLKLGSKEGLSHAISKLSMEGFTARIYGEIYQRGKQRRKNPRMTQEQMIWKCWKPVIPQLELGVYDEAIACSYGIPFYYIIDKVRAVKRTCWIEDIYEGSKAAKEWDGEYFKLLHKLVSPSAAVEQSFLSCFPELVLQIESEVQHFTLKEEEKEERLLASVVSWWKPELEQCLLQTVSILLEKGQHFTWYLAGKGKCSRDFIKQIKKLGLDNQIKVWEEHQSIRKLIQRAEYFVTFTENDEWQPYLEEAKQSGKLIIAAFDEKKPNQIAHGKNGMIIPANEWEVAHCLDFLFRNGAVRRQLKNNLCQERIDFPYII